MSLTDKKGIINYIDPNIKSINRIILEGDNKPTLLQKLGSNESLLDLTTFCEYGLDYYINKYGDTDNDPLNLLTDKNKKRLGDNIEDIKKIRDTLFPTMIEESNENSTISYFGTITVNDQKLLLIDVPSGYKSAKLFDETKTESSNIDVIFNESDIPFRKIVWIVITSGDDNSIEDINISYITWSYSNNPNRNLENYLLSPKLDKVNSFSNTFNHIDLDTVENVDNSSGTILGNQNIYLPSILESMLDNYKDNSFDYSNKLYKYNRNINYKKGQQVIYLGKIWESLEDDNLNNLPTFSNSWIKSLNILNNVERGFVNIYNSDKLDNINETCTINPIIFTIPKDNKSPIIFNMELKDGYVIDETYKNYLNVEEIYFNGYKPLGKDIFNHKVNLIPEINFDIYKTKNRKVEIKINSDFLIIQENKFKISEFKLRKFDCKLDTTEYNEDIEDLNKGYIITFTDIKGKNIDHIPLGEDYIINFDFSNYIDSYSSAELIEHFLISGNHITIPSITREISSISENPIFSITKKATYPATYNYLLLLYRLQFKVTVVDSFGFYSNKTSDIAINDSDELVFKFCPTDNYFEDTVSLSINDDLVIKCPPLPKAPHMPIPSIDIKEGYYGKTYYRFSRLDRVSGVNNYYELIINYKKDSNPTKLDKDLSIKIWK